MNTRSLATTAVLLLAASANAAILFDMGPAGATPAPTNSPAHATGAVPLTEVTWNAAVFADLTSGILNSDNTAATGVSLTYGRTSSTTSTVIDYSLTGPSTTSGGGGSSGIYSGGSAIKDNVYYNTTGGYRLGIRIDGLAAGNYDVYVTARNTASTATTLSSQVYYGVGASASTFETATASSAAIANSQSVNSGNATYVLGDQYQVLHMTVGASESVFLAVRGSGTESRPFLNSVEIVLAPEPAMLGLAGLALSGAMLRRRR